MEKHRLLLLPCAGTLFNNLRLSRCSRIIAVRTLRWQIPTIDEAPREPPEQQAVVRVPNARRDVLRARALLLAYHADSASVRLRPSRISFETDVEIYLKTSRFYNLSSTT